MYLLKLFIILQALSFSLSFDIELEGVLRLGDGILDILSNKTNPDEKHPLPQHISVRSKSKLPKKFSRSSIMRANSVGMNRSDELLEFVDYIKTKGITTLKTVSKQIFKGMKLRKNFTRQVDVVTNNYATTIQQYLEYVLGQKTKFTIDEELTFLDILETACRLLYREQKKILNYAVAAANLVDNRNMGLNSTQKYNLTLKLKSTEKNNKTSKLVSTKVPREADIQSVSQMIYRQGVKTKRDALRHICNKYEICRPYPAFTDYLADFIVEILKLPDEKLETFIKLLRVLAKTNEEFFNSITEQEDKEIVIVPELSELLNNVNGFQETLLLVRGVLTQRFKIISNPNLKLKMRAQAVRILLDIINHAFQYENDDILAMEFDTAVRNIRSWNNGQRHFPESSLISLINNIVNVLDYNLSADAKTEVKVLIETLIKGSSINEEVFRKLFSEGSKYVKGEDIVHGLEII